MSWRILISAPYFLPSLEHYRAQLEAQGMELVIAHVRERLSEAELLPLVTTIHGAICGDDQFTERVLRAAVNLRVISKWGTGIDSIDTNAAARLGIRVCNTPDAFTDCVADSTLGYILNFARQLFRMDQEVRSGKWIKPDAVTLRECTLGVIGVGNIGKAVVRRAAAFGMTILGYDPVKVPEVFCAETGLRLVSLPDLLQSSDFVTLHCDLNPTSYHLIDRAQLELMRSTTYLINTSRGSVVNERALVEGLQTGQIAGAALDVFEVEPLPADSPLRKLNNCLLAPHNANGGRAAKQRVHESTIRNLITGLKQADR
jgi:D-3-phosphoglycerate dehydrogenase / 2-oxoglutarate reductase